MRAFTAVDIEDTGIKLELEKLQRKLDFGFNLVKSEKMHITLQFFQEIEDEEAEEIIAAIKETDIEPFKLEIRGAGVFPSKDHLRVVWAGVESEEIYELKEQVSDHSVESSNNHDFHPHVTLARVDSVSARHRKQFRETLEDVEDEVIGKIEVDSVKLFESIRTGNGTEYRELEEVEL
ncbi:MAG: RNA 2',3'-cyclic phosphodiesterase [Candidatus Nanohalobium sp.]